MHDKLDSTLCPNLKKFRLTLHCKSRSVPLRGYLWLNGKTGELVCEVPEEVDETLSGPLKVPAVSKGPEPVAVPSPATTVLYVLGPLAFMTPEQQPYRAIAGLLMKA